MSVAYPRLSDRTLAAAAAGAHRPDYDRGATEVGIVHFGPGAFHRVHQAWYVDRLLARDPSWAITAVSLKTPGVRDALQAQDGLYALAELDEAPSLRVIGAVKEVLVAPEAPAAVLARLAAPGTRVVTATVTEKGYCLDGAGELDLAHPDIVADLSDRDAPCSLIGWLVAGLKARRAAGVAPFVTLSCDNLTDNGVKLGRAVVRFAHEKDPALADWIETCARFPRTMVDSIAPATDDALRAQVAGELGLRDAWPVQRETFTQWVIEDLGQDGPDWGSVGATLTTDVAAFAQAKLRLLNGPHSTLAYLGLLAMHETVSEAMTDPDLACFLERMMFDDILPTVRAAPGMDLPAYARSILKRFRNPAIRHNLSQIAWDGSQKLPFRILGTIEDALAAGRPVNRLALPLAGWMRFVARQARAGIALVDPLAAGLARIGAQTKGDAEADVPLFLALDQVFPEALARDPRFVRPLTAAYAGLVAHGPQAAAAGL